MANSLRILSKRKSPELKERRTDAAGSPSLVIARIILIGFAIGGALGIYLGIEFGWVVGIVTTWLSGNAFSLLLAYGWYRFDGAKRRRLGVDEQEPDSETSSSTVRYRDAA